MSNLLCSSCGSLLQADDWVAVVPGPAWERSSIGPPLQWETNRRRLLTGLRPFAGPRPLILHLDCFSPWEGSRPLHAEVFPDCPERWHDMYDHASLTCETLAVARHVLSDPTTWLRPEEPRP